ncbi:MAG: F0F1 ATP synthase subunit delta [Bdellovibrionales bacterium]|nr:F0F1 ATP synthase subunit delta [Bdellovibrionales bacterium]
MKSKKSYIYAQVLFEEDSSLEFLKHVKIYSDILLESSISSFFFSLFIPLREKQKLLEQALSSAPPLLVRFFTVLLKNKSFPLLSEIVKKYQELIERKNNRTQALVYSPKKLGEREKLSLKQALEGIFSKKIEIQEKEDKSLIAGLLVDVEGYMFESNIKQFLKKFEKTGGL